MTNENARSQLRPYGRLARLVEIAVAAYRRAHHKAITLLDDALDIERLPLRMDDDDIGLLASIDDLRHRIEHGLVLVLPRVAELLGKVALADQDGADAGHVFQNVFQIRDAFGVLDHQNNENLTLGIERPYVG